MIYLFIGIYVLVGISYTKGMLSMETVSSELNVLSSKVGTGATPIETPLHDSKVLCLVAVVLWPLLAVIGFVGG